jgi:tetratricopeptide (TPR) repeat protein
MSKFLTYLIKNITPDEKKLIRRYLSSFSSRNERETKLLKLFDIYIKSSTAYSDETISKKIYGVEKVKTLGVLKSRLETKILDSLTLEINLKKKKNTDLIDIATFKCWNNLLTIHYLLRKKGNSILLNNLIINTENLALKFEIFPVAVEVLRLKKYIKGFSSGLKEFSQINTDILKAEKTSQLIQKANDYYYTLILRKDFTGFSAPKKHSDNLWKIIGELEEDYHLTRASAIKYYKKLLEIEYHTLNKDYFNSIKCTQELLSIVSENPAIKRKQRISYCYMRLGYFSTSLKNFIKAESYYNSSLKHTIEGDTNYWVIKELSLLNHIYKGDYNLCSKLISEITSKYKGEKSIFRTGKFHYYQANIFFYLQNFKTCRKNLGLVRGFPLDLEGWDFCFRILEIMCLIELEDFDQSAIRIDDLVRQYYRLRDSGDITERNLMILTVLSDIAKKGFSYQNLNQKTIDLVLRLREKGKGHSWEPFTPEIIPFHEWISGKSKVFSQKSKARVKV